MNKLMLGMAATSMFALGALTLMLWPARASNAQSTSRPLQGEQCTSINRVTICTYKFDDGVRCLYAGAGKWGHSSFSCNNRLARRVITKAADCYN